MYESSSWIFFKYVCLFIVCYYSLIFFGNLLFSLIVHTYFLRFGI